jgi:hypothetical protein
MDPRVSQSVCFELRRESFFLGAVDLFNYVDD